MTNDQVNPPTHLFTPLLDCIMIQSNSSNPVSSSLDRLSSHLDQSSPNLTQSIHNLTSVQSNVNLNQPNPPTILSNPLSDCIMLQSSPLPSQAVSSNLDQFTSNLNQPILKSTECTSNLDPKSFNSHNLNQSSPNTNSNHTLFQMKQNPISPNFSMNLEAATEQSIHDVSDLMTFQSNQNLDQQSPNLTQPGSESNSTLPHTNHTLNQSTTLFTHQPEPQVTKLNSTQLKSTKQKSVKCPKCGKFFTNRNSLGVHSFNKHPAQLPLCEVSGCGETFETKTRLIQHYRHVHRGLNFPCEQCYKRKKLIVDHLRTYHQIDFDQPKINLGQSSPNLIQSQTKPNSILQQTNLILNQSITFSSISTQHPEPQITQRRRSKKQKSVYCPKCGKLFKHKNSFRAHCFKYHPAQSPHCEVSGCGKTFETKALLIKHYRYVHRGVNFPCAKCYNRNELIVDHLRTYHQIDFDPPKLKQPSPDSTPSTANSIPIRMVESNSLPIQFNDTIANISTLTQFTNAFVDTMPVQQQIVISNNDDQYSIILQQTQSQSQFDQILNLFEQPQGIEAEHQRIESTNSVLNTIDSQDCVDYLATIQIDNLNFLDEIDMTPDHVNPPTHLSTPLSDCIMSQSNPLTSQSISSSSEQFCVNLDKPSLNSTQNQTFFQINQNPNSSNFCVNLETATEQSCSIEDISDLIIFHSNQYQDQSNLNLTQNSESQHIFKQPDPIQCSSVIATDVNPIFNSSLAQISLVKKSSILQSLLSSSISPPSNVIKKNRSNQVILSSQVPGQDKPRFICTEDNCEKTFSSHSGIKKHQKIVHQGKSLKFRCTWVGCGLEFPRHNHLRKHREQAHTGVTVYKCDKCNHTSTIKHNLTIHRKTVHEKAMFMCKFANCGQMFSNYIKMSQHRKSVHTAGGKHKCEVEDCGLGFDSIAFLRRHREQKHKIRD